MEFNDEIIKRLADEGIVFTKNNTGSMLTYRTNHGHMRATVFAGRSYQSLLPHFKIMSCDMETVNKVFPEDADLEKVLRDVAEATGNMDQAIENFKETIGDYTDIK